LNLKRYTKTHLAILSWLRSYKKHNKTIYLYEQWDSKEEHQAYLNWRMETGFGDFMGEILEGEFSLSYLSNVGA
jgi:quinol monooxygenase YgiN